MYSGFKELYQNYPELEEIDEEMKKAAEKTEQCFRNGNKLLLCGNGGSAADCQHIAGELMKGFISRRKIENKRKRLFAQAGMEKDFYECLQEGLPAIALTGQDALSTAILNDINAEFLYAQQIYAIGKPGDMLWAISTSGNAENVKNAVKVAKALGIETLAFTGEQGGWLAQNCDCTLKAPAKETYRVQEYHLPMYHALCREVERKIFD